MARGNSKANSEFIKNEERARADKEVASDNAREIIASGNAKDAWFQARRNDEDSIDADVDNHVKGMFADIQTIVPNFQEKEFFQDFEDTRDAVREAIKGKATDDQIDEINEKLSELKSLYDTRKELRDRRSKGDLVVGGNPFGVADDVEIIDDFIKDGFFPSQGMTGLRNNLSLAEAENLANSIIRLKRGGFETSQANATAAREYLSDIKDSMARLKAVEERYEEAEASNADGIHQGPPLDRIERSANQDAERHLVTLRTAFDGLATIAFDSDDMYRRILKD